MKIGKLTFDGYNNYGNTLQNYALQEFLLNYADSVDTLWHSPDEMLSEYWKWGKKEEIKFLTNHNKFRTEVKKGYRAWELARRARFLDFQKRYIKVRYGIDNLSDVVNEYDFFVVGSDQVWNPGNKRLETAFLKFAPSHKRISFAASIGAQYIPDEKKHQYMDGLKGMKAISVRESRAVEIIDELTGIKALEILDPVFCISENRWREIYMKPYWLEDKPFIFTYFLGRIPESVNRFAKENNLEIINCFDREKIEYCIISPEEWLYLIGNAEYVITDSFHATAFSIIFNRKFYVFQRFDDERRKQMVTRLVSLLHKFNMQTRLVNEDFRMVPEQKDCFNTKAIIESEVLKSGNFIQQSFG